MLSFDRAAEIYDQTRGFPPGIGERVAAALLEFTGLSARDPILEIGIGTGRIAKPLAAVLGPAHRLVGIDVSRKMMGRLQETVPPGVKPPHLVEANAEALPFPAQSFRAVTFVHVLHLLRNWQTVVADCVRLLAPGGMLIGGWNDHPPESSGERINHKFREIAKDYGVCVERQGLVNFSDLLRHWPGARAEEMAAAEWVIQRAPRLALQSIAERHFSSAWLVPDDLHPLILAEVEAWAKKEWPDLDRAIPEPRRFKWMKVEGVTA